MSLHNDLVDQANTLARLDPRRPKQASLRRAVSTAYYALFHLLASEASALYADDFEIGARISRTLNHPEMRKTSSMFANDKLPRGIQPSAGAYKAPVDLKFVAETFVSLQQARHEADYDLTRKFRRKETLDFVRSVRLAFEAWAKI